MSKLRVRKLLAEAVEGHGFTQRGDAFFRVKGDGVLQVLKFEYERSLCGFCLDVGLFSMYGELRRSWFTSSGCIPRYPVASFVGKSPFGVIFLDSNSVSFDIFSPSSQIQILKDSVLPILDNAQDQKQLVSLICQLDVARWHTVRWNDFEKFAPYLKSRDIESAEKVIKRILSLYCRLPTDSDDALRQYLFSNSVDSMDEEKRALVLKLAMVQKKDWNEINNYLCENFERNSGFASFCISSK